MSSERSHPGGEFKERLDVASHRLIFIGGLHRSGTTLLGRILADHQDISGFSGTSAQEDEGQHLQSVYAPAIQHGGPGRFARSAAAHLTELPDAEAVLARHRLLNAWSPHWDLSQSLLVEKSPPNLIMGRYLQSVFPGSALLVIIRHPLVVALSTKKWTRLTSLPDLVDHWFVAHDLLMNDAARLDRLHVIRYEDLMSAPTRTLTGIQRFLGIDTELNTDRLEETRSNRYVRAWDSMASGSPIDRLHRRTIEKRFAQRLGDYGYRLDDLTQVDPWSLGRSS